MKTRTVRRVLGGSVLVLLGGALLLGGVVQGRGGGYFTTSAERFASPTAALVTDEIDVGTGRPSDPDPDLGELSRLRVRVVSADPDARLFVGIGPRDAVRAYLAGTAHDQFTGATTRPFHATFSTRSGRAVAPTPAAQPIWVAGATGTGAVTLEWDKTAGPWALVVANEDGRPGLDVRADLGFRFGFLLPLGAGWVVLSAALLLTVSLRPSSSSSSPADRSTALASADGRTAGRPTADGPG